MMTSRATQELPERDRLMKTCAPECLPHYPWVGNPDGNFPGRELPQIKATQDVGTMQNETLFYN